MRYDIEFPLAQLFASYLTAQCATFAGGVLDPVLCPIVTFFDPMSVDSADRVIVKVPSADTMPECGGNFKATIEVYQKTQWHQATLKAEMLAHSQRINEVRDKLQSSQIIALMTPLMPAGLSITWVNPRMAFTLNTYGDKGGWIASETTIMVAGFLSPGT